MRWQGRGNVDQLVSDLDGSITEYESVFREITGKELSSARILEIGYGARPLRMFWLRSLGYNVMGVDLDRPVLFGGVNEFFDMWKKNGGQRFLKSIVRHFVFDRSEWRGLDKVLKGRGLDGLVIEADRFVVKDASLLDFRALYPEGADFIYSEDVFEHVPGPALEMLLANLAKALGANGCAVFRPHIFTSITGGHLPEWYPHITRVRSSDRLDCRSEPWEHLRKRRFKANTYLNEFRIIDYRRVIERHFKIVSEVNYDQELGRRFLNPTVMADVQGIGEEELLLNNVRFLCIPLSGA